MSDVVETRATPPLRVAFCADADAIDRFRGLMRHMVVGLVDQAVHLQLVSADARVESLCLGPVRAFVHERMAWPFARRRVAHLIEEISTQRPTVVHAFGRGSYGVAREMADAFDAELILTVTSLADCKALGKVGARGAQRIFACSAPLVRVVVDQLRAPADKVSLIRPGVQVMEQAACFAKAGRIPAILCTSPLTRKSGVDDLLEAVDMLRARDHELMLFLLGRGSYERAIRQQIHKRRLSSVVTLAHPSGDLTGALRNADIFVLPSETPLLSADTLQAMGAGVAVVAYPNTVSDYLRAGETAVVCEQPSVEVLANAIEGLLRDRDEAQAMAKRGMTHVRTHHTVSEETQRMADVYRELALSRKTIPLGE